MHTSGLRLRDPAGRTHDFPDLRLTASRAGLVGDWESLFRLFCGERTLAGGRLSIGGVSIPRELGHGRVGVALRPSTWPRGWKVCDYLATSAELAGFGRREARAAGERALAGLGLERLRAQRLSLLAEPEARGVKLAEALVTDPTVLVVELPTEDLDAESGYWVLEVLRRASTGRRLLASFLSWPVTAPGHSLLHAMDRIVQVQGDIVEERVPDAEASAPRRRYRLVLAEPARALVEALKESGWSLVARPWVVVGVFPSAPSPAALEWVADLPASESTESHIERLLALSRSLGTPVLELVPIPAPLAGRAQSGPASPAPRSG